MAVGHHHTDFMGNTHMRSRTSGYTSSTARAIARRTAKREQARKWFYEEGISKEEIMERLNVSRTSVNLYLRDQSSIIRRPR